MNSVALERQKSKSPEHSLAWNLAAQAGMNPAQVGVALDLFAQHQQKYFGDDRGPGQIVHTAVHKSEPAGKPIKDCRMTPVKLTLYDAADAEVHDRSSVTERRMRILRLTQEAYDQDGLLSQADLAVLLAVDESTVKDQIHILRAEGFVVPTRGWVKDMGPEPSHKAIIARMLARGHTTSEIRAATRHSETSISRYQHQFAQVLFLLHQYPEAGHEQRCTVSGLPRRAYDIYVEIYRELRDDDNCRPHLERLRRRFEMEPDRLTGSTPSGKKPDDDSLRRLEQQTLDNAVRQTIQKDLGTTPCIAQAVTQDIMRLIDQTLLMPESSRPGEVIILADKHDAAFLSGERVKDRPIIPVTVPLVTEEVKALWRADEPVGIRRARIAALIASSAAEQGAVMSIAGLAECLHTTPSLLSANLRELAALIHIQAPTKGLLEDAGPTLTHKDWIIDLDQHGLTGQEITWLTRHAPASRDRYLSTFRRAEALMHMEGRIPEAEHLASLLRIRTHVACQYVDLLVRYHPDHIPGGANGNAAE